MLIFTRGSRWDPEEGWRSLNLNALNVLVDDFSGGSDFKTKHVQKFWRWILMFCIF
jgi:hypothetical protein